MSASRTEPEKNRVTQAIFYIVWLALAAFPLIQGMDYYQLEWQERAYSTDHELFRPAGIWGHSLGILGSLMMIVGVAMYSTRKRFAALERFGKLSSWLAVHIFLCTLGPFFVVLHTSFRLQGLVAISFWSMVLVVASGIFGRYVYIRIPKSLNGQFQDAANIRSQQSNLIDHLNAESVDNSTIEIVKSLLPSEHGNARSTSLVKSIRSSILSRRDRRRFEVLAVSKIEPLRLSAEHSERLIGLAVEHWRLEKQLELMKPFQRLFGYWHVFHLPLAIVMFLILFLHVGVAIAFGYSWIF